MPYQEEKKGFVPEPLVLLLLLEDYPVLPTESSVIQKKRCKGLEEQ